MYIGWFRFESHTYLDSVCGAFVQFLNLKARYFKTIQSLLKCREIGDVYKHLPMTLVLLLAIYISDLGPG